MPRLFPFLERVSCQLRRGQRKYEPTVSRVNRFKTEDVAQESADFVGIFGVNERVNSIDHSQTIARFNYPITKFLIISIFP